MRTQPKLRLDPGARSGTNVKKLPPGSDMRGTLRFSRSDADLGSWTRSADRRERKTTRNPALGLK
jgi:hypothetical protein